MTFDARTFTSDPGGLVSFESTSDMEMIGCSSLFNQTLQVIDSVAANDCIVLLEGESGTGKELLARRIHAKSPRAARAFIPLNCAGVSESLFASQLFGHVKGAFTGAEGETLGVVRAAEGGTLLLDEIGDIPFALQAHLLRLIQQHEVIPVGSSKPIYVNTRFVVSTNRSLGRMVQEGKFRLDLYHRLNIVRIEVPPLRSRPEDVSLLLDYFLDRFAYEYGRRRIQISPLLRSQICSYQWPGNVRELEGYVERLYATGCAITPPQSQSWDDGYDYGSDDFTVPSAQSCKPVNISPAPGRMTGYGSDETIYSLAHVEKQAIAKALDHTSGNKSIAAKLLDIHRTTLIRKIRHYGLG